MDIVTIYQDTPVVEHRVIAQQTGTKEKSVLDIITRNTADFEEFGSLAILNRKTQKQGGRPQKAYLLNEPQAALLMTYLKNTPIVRKFKKALVKAFYELKGKESNQNNHDDIMETFVSAIAPLFEMLNSSFSMLAETQQLILKELSEKQKEVTFEVTEEITTQRKLVQVESIASRKRTEDIFIEAVRNLLANEEDINQTQLLNTLGRAKDNKTARAILDRYEGVYWVSQYHGKERVYKAL